MISAVLETPTLCCDGLGKRLKVPYLAAFADEVFLKNKCNQPHNTPYIKRHQQNQ